MSDTVTPAGGPHSNKAMIRNIITGVITTVLGGSILYFVGARHGGEVNDPRRPPDFLVLKEATMGAWKSYVAIDNLYYKNLQSIAKDKQLMSDLDKYKAEVFKEADRFRKDAELILKDKHIDNAFISMVNRRFDRETESRDYLNDWIAKIKAIRDANVSDSEKLRRATVEINNYTSYSKGVLERAANEVEGLAKSLAEKYGPSFDLNDFLLYVDYKKGVFSLDSLKNNNSGNPAPADSNINRYNTVKIDAGTVTGKWNTTGAILTYTKNGKFSWEVLTTGDKSSGTWKVENNQLVMKPTAGDKIGKNATWIFDLTNVSPQSFTMKLTNQPFNTYSLVRIKN